MSARWRRVPPQRRLSDRDSLSPGLQGPGRKFHAGDGPIRSLRRSGSGGRSRFHRSEAKRRNLKRRGEAGEVKADTRETSRARGAGCGHRRQSLIEVLAAIQPLLPPDPTRFMAHYLEVVRSFYRAWKLATRGAGDEGATPAVQMAFDRIEQSAAEHLVPGCSAEDARGCVRPVDGEDDAGWKYLNPKLELPNKLEIRNPN